MCSAGGGDFDIDIEQLELERYKCNDCGNKFDAMGEKVVCSSCMSERKRCKDITYKAISNSNETLRAYRCGYSYDSVAERYMKRIEAQR
jgi:predicted amidophosphoribosyltransferase